MIKLTNRHLKDIEELDYSYLKKGEFIVSYCGLANNLTYETSLKVNKDDKDIAIIETASVKSLKEKGVKEATRIIFNGKGVVDFISFKI